MRQDSPRTDGPWPGATRLTRARCALSEAELPPEGDAGTEESPGLWVLVILSITLHGRGRYGDHGLLPLLGTSPSRWGSRSS
jgi:hypothetical protein